MDNENKVKTESLFLKEDPAQFLAKTESYSLDEEFSKTKKNRNFFLVSLFALFIGVVLAGTFFIGVALQNQNRKMDININDFEDLNLKELLTDSKKNYAGLIQARQDLADLRNNLKADLAQTWQDITNQMELVREKDLPDAEKQADLNQILQDGQKTAASVQSEYQIKINRKEGDIFAIQNSISHYDQKMMESAQKSEQILADNQRLSDMELRKQKKEFEDKIREIEKKNQSEQQALKDYFRKYIDVLILKYNPVFTDPVVLALLPAQPAPQPFPTPSLTGYSDLLYQGEIIEESDFKALRKNIRDYYTLLQQMKKISYTNSIPPTLNRLNALSLLIIQQYEQLWGKLSSYSYALESYLTVNPENGYVLDGRETNSIAVYINKIYKVREGDTALVFRNDDEYIGTVRFYYNHGGLSARVQELSEGEKPSPFDKLLIRLKEE